jgi:glyoxylase-like metal-dependent hydrolase (beta-lactamase superfamily II)
MHPDHVGGLVSNGAIQFPNAVVHATKADADFWLSAANLERAPNDARGFFQGAMASVNPYAQHAQLQLFEGTVDVVPGIHSYPSAGHTVGHTSYVVESDGQKLLILGDLIHVAPCQGFPIDRTPTGFWRYISALRSTETSAPDILHRSSAPTAQPARPSHIG